MPDQVYYQIPDDYSPSPLKQEYYALVSSVGENLLDASGNQLYAIAAGTQVDSSLAISMISSQTNPITTRGKGTQLSEVEVSLLGVRRIERSQQQYAIVNTYALDPKEYSGQTSYTYPLDPTQAQQIEPIGEFTGNFGRHVRHFPQESCIQAYAYPPPFSFVWPDPATAPSGYFPGGRRDGVMTATIDAVRAIRYQPGRITKVTLGVKASGAVGGRIRWGCRNQYGDAYYFELRDGEFWIVRETPGKPILQVPRTEWNGDPLDGSQDLWVLRPDRLTMFQIEFGWYGAIGAKFMAFVPFDAGPGSGDRWIRLHSIDWLDPVSADAAESAGSGFSTPSLRNPFMRLFCDVRAVAGVTEPQFISIYGTSAYIEGGDEGTVTNGVAVASNRAIDTNLRQVLGLQARATIPNNDAVNIDNQKIILPTVLNLFSTANATVQVVTQQGDTNEISYGYGLGRTVANNLGLGSLQSVSGCTLDASRQIVNGDFSSVTISSEPDPFRTLIRGTGLFHLYAVEKISNSQIRLNRALPAYINFPSTISFDPFSGRAFSNEVIASGITSGRVLLGLGGLARVGLWPSNGRPISSYAATETAWGFRVSTFVNYSILGDAPIESSTATSTTPGTSAASWAISGNTLTFNGSTVPMLGYPLIMVAEFRQGASINNPVFDYGVSPRVTIPVTFQGLVNATVTEPVGGAGYAVSQFKTLPNLPLTGAIFDDQGSQVLASPTVLHSVYLSANQPMRFDLSDIFGVDRMFLSRIDSRNPAAVFIAARTNSGTGQISASLGWKEVG